MPWLILMVLPFWEAGRLVVAGFIIGASLHYVYLLLLGKRFDQPGSAPGGSFFSLKGVIRLFQHPRATLAGWTHFVAFDLMVGLFIVSDGGAQGISHWLLIPPLIATLMLGPSGLLLYLLIRMFFGVSPLLLM
ncbi:MAG: ABA4-like family protein [Ketobacteraceae bacterium]|nr:ABA4-like family protein [Ketobacteraceae bacterium]